MKSANVDVQKVLCEPVLLQKPEGKDFFFLKEAVFIL